MSLLSESRLCTHTQGRIQFFIDALDRDVWSGETEVLINRFPINLELELGADFTERTTYTGIYNISGLGFDMSFRVQCSVNSDGPSCTTLCKPMRVYTCDNKGNSICVQSGRDPITECTHCLQGWLNSNTNCTTCLYAFYDIQTNCTQCLPGRDIASNCTTCLPGYNPATSCTQCLSGRDASTNCTACLPGYNDFNCTEYLCPDQEAITITTSTASSKYVDDYATRIILFLSEIFPKCTSLQ